MVYIDFYHYTSTSGKNAIVSSRVIKKSVATDRRDACYGEGVYGTNLSPKAGKRKIAQNNWDDNTQPTARIIRVYGTNLSPEAGKRKIAQNNWYDNTQPTARMIRKASWAFKVNIPERELKVAYSTRDILIYPGDLHLDDYYWEVIKV